MQSARRSVADSSPASTKPGASTMPVAPQASIAASTCGRCGPSPKTTPRRFGDRRPRAHHRRHDGRRALLGDVAPGEDDERIGRVRCRRLEAAGVLALEHADLAAEALGEQPVAMQAREAERAVRHARAGALDRVPQAPLGAAEVAVPVGPAPQLVPVDDEPVAAARLRRRRREHREVRKRRHVHDVVLAAVAQQVAERAAAEAQRLADRAVAVRPVERLGARDRHDAHALEQRPRAVLPLASRDVRHVVAVLREALGEVAIPALRAAHGPGKQAVIGDADAHVADTLSAACERNGGRRALR